MRYITREMTRAALATMQYFHDRQHELHLHFDIDFVTNTGRRNIIMSAAQEEFFAREIGKSLKDVIVDGRTGKADIFVGELNRELECKLTTPNGTTGAISFNTDYETLLSKGSLDYLYVIVSADFNKFCVLHFAGLTVDDFRPPYAGARGKSAMIKSKGMQKCEVLWGAVETQNGRSVERFETELASRTLKLSQDCDDTRGRLVSIEAALERDVDFMTGEPLRSRRRCGMRKIRDRLKTRPERLGKKYKQDVLRINKKIAEAQRRPPQYTFILHDLDEG